MVEGHILPYINRILESTRRVHISSRLQTQEDVQNVAYTTSCLHHTRSGDVQCCIAMFAMDRYKQEHFSRKHVLLVLAVLVHCFPVRLQVLEDLACRSQVCYRYSLIQIDTSGTAVRQSSKRQYGCTSERVI